MGNFGECRLESGPEESPLCLMERHAFDSAGNMDILMAYMQETCSDDKNHAKKIYAYSDI